MSSMTPINRVAFLVLKHVVTIVLDPISLRDLVPLTTSLASQCAVPEITGLSPCLETIDETWVAVPRMGQRFTGHYTSLSLPIGDRETAARSGVRFRAIGQVTGLC